MRLVSCARWAGMSTIARGGLDLRGVCVTYAFNALRYKRWINHLVNCRSKYVKLIQQAAMVSARLAKHPLVPS
jgi:hypothetical protein